MRANKTDLPLHPGKETCGCTSLFLAQRRLSLVRSGAIQSLENRGTEKWGAELKVKMVQ